MAGQTCAWKGWAMANHRDMQNGIPEPGYELDLSLPGEKIGRHAMQVGHTTQRPVLLLVHGAWHGAWNWEKVRRLLTATGWEIQTVDLPSMADKGKQRFGMHDDAECVRGAVQRIGRSVVVVAHSYGGIPVTEGVADLPNVRHIVYLAAFQFDVGESQLGLTGGKPAPWWIIEDDTMTPGTPRDIFYADVAAVEAESAIARLKPQSVVVVTETVAAAAWHTIPSTYVVCTQDRAIPPVIQEQMAQRATSVRHLNTSHSPFLSRPDDVARLITEVAVSVT